MRQAALGPGLRLLIGVLGVVVLVAGVAAGIAEIRSATHASAPFAAIILALVCLGIGCTGVLLLRGAWRGQIGVRDPAGRATRHLR